MSDNKEVSRVLELIVARAVMDSQFREQLLSDKSAVAQEYNLSGADLEALQRIDAAALEAARELATMIPVVHLQSEEQE